MSAESSLFYLTEDEYLKLELNSDIRHEYIAGQIYAMAGGSEEHDLINTNILTFLYLKLKNTGCRVFSGNMKIKIENLDLFYYPDISVTCEERDNQKYFKSYPCLIIEILSPSTERVDRTEKLRNYRELLSLKEYILISQNQIKVEIYRKNKENNWELEILTSSDILKLQSVGLEISILDIYEGIKLVT